LLEPSGKARLYIVKQLFSLKPEDADESTLKTAEEHIKNLFEKGEMDQNKKYNDYELCLKLRIFLNDLSQKLAQLSQKYLAAYQKASTEKEKSSFFEKHKASYDASQTIDTWLKDFKL